MKKPQQIKSWPPTQEELDRLPKRAREGMQILMKASEDPKTKLAAAALQVWSDTLTDAEKHWLQHTTEGRREMWSRYNHAFGLTAPIEGFR